MMTIRAMKVGVMSTTVFSSICHLPGHLFGSDSSVLFARYLPGCFLGYDGDQGNGGGCNEHAQPCSFPSAIYPDTYWGLTAVCFCLDISKGAFWGMAMMKVGVMNTTVFSISYLLGALNGV